MLHWTLNKKSAALRRPPMVTSKFARETHSIHMDINFLLVMKNAIDSHTVFSFVFSYFLPLPAWKLIPSLGPARPFVCFSTQVCYWTIIRDVATFNSLMQSSRSASHYYLFVSFLFTRHRACLCRLMLHCAKWLKPARYAIRLRPQVSHFQLLYLGITYLRSK